LFETQMSSMGEKGRKQEGSRCLAFVVTGKRSLAMRKLPSIGSRMS
jgi:hypothetical protein